MVIGTYILIITLKVNGLNAPTKRHRLVEWIQKQDPLYSVYKGHIQTESEGMEGLEKLPIKRNKSTRISDDLLGTF